MFEVRTTAESDVLDNQYNVETRRTSRAAAEQDLELLKLFGKKAWIVDLNE